LRSSASEAMMPASSNCSSSSYWSECSDGSDLFRGLADDGDDVDRVKPSEAAALVLLDFVKRDERAGVAWKDMA
jgi:hypothetical protein